jgi:protein tyrosine/serine phosphatase
VTGFAAVLRHFAAEWGRLVTLCCHNFDQTGLIVAILLRLAGGSSWQIVVAVDQST